MTLATSTHSALEAAYREHHERVHAFLRGALADQSRADDLAHDTFITYAGHVERGEEIKNTEAYLMSLAVGHLLNEIGRLKNIAAGEAGRGQESLLDEPRDDAALVWPFPPTSYDDVAFAEAFDNALRELPENELHAFLLHDIRGVGWEEAGDLLGAPPQTVYDRAEAARLKLKTALA